MEEMKAIRFSEHYKKLYNLKDKDIVVLCEVILTRFENLSEVLRFWDTLYYKENKANHYPLPKEGECIILIFWAGNFFFPTIRPTKQTKPIATKKYDYYRSMIGKQFILSIGEN